MLGRLLFVGVAAAILANCATTIYSIIRPEHRVWPPPSRRSWQYRYDGFVSMAGMFGLLALGVVDWNSLALPGTVRFALARATRRRTRLAAPASQD